MLQALGAQLQRLPEGVREHIEQVLRQSVALAKRHGLDVPKAELAAQMHDICRTTKAPDLLRMAAEFGIPLKAIDQAFPVFLHGPVGAAVLQRDFGVNDPEILDPVRYHTMARARMSSLEKVLFLADKLDPSKVARYPYIGEVERLALEHLSQGMRCFLENQTKAYMQSGQLVHPSFIEAWNEVVGNVR